MGAEVGWGLPPEGSSEMASAAVESISAGIAGTMSITFPEASGRNIAALMGFAFFHASDREAAAFAGMRERVTKKFAFGSVKERVRRKDRFEIGQWTAGAED